MASQYAIFIDVGYLSKGSAKVLGIAGARARIDPAAALTVLQALITHEPFLRAYWYDGEYPTSHPSHAGQKAWLSSVGLVPGLTLRLGAVKYLRPPWMVALEKALKSKGLSAKHLGLRLGPIDTQKGVDTLMVLDLVRLGQRRAFSTAVLVAGDRDLLEPLRVVQDEGCQVILVAPVGYGVDPDLRRACDRFIELDTAACAKFVSCLHSWKASGAKDPSGNLIYKCEHCPATTIIP